jgi:hypothetical protein
MTTQQPAATPTPPAGSARPKIIGAAALVAVLVVVAGLFVFVGSDDAAAGEIFVEPLGSTGPDPFTDSITPEPVATLADYAARPATDPDVDPELVPEGVSPDPVPAESVRALVEAAEGASVPLLVGTRPGVYGGTRDEASCDADQLVSFLADDQDKAAAWAGVHDIEVDEIAAFVADLTPLRLTRDTLVLNHRFVDGEAEPRQTVLQKGEAVMVDDSGIPRVKCSSGNPLLAPDAPELLTDGDVGGEPWDGFDASTVGVVVPAADPVEEFVVVDVETDELFIRLVGSVVEADIDAVAVPESTPTPAPTPTPAAPTPTPVPPTATPVPTPAAINPFDDPDPDLADLPIPDDLPPGAGTFAAPREGTWLAGNGAGSVTCDGFTIPLPPTSGETGTLALTDEGFTFGAGGISIELAPVEGITGRYAGTVTTVEEGIAVTSDLVLQVVTDTLLVGSWVGNFEAEGTTCTAERSLEMTFSG